MSTSKIQLVYAKCRVGLLLISVGVCLCFGLLFANIAALRNKDSTVILFPFLPTPGRNSVSFNLVLRPRKYFGFSRLIFLKWRNSQASRDRTHSPLSWCHSLACSWPCDLAMSLCRSVTWGDCQLSLVNTAHSALHRSLDLEVRWPLVAVVALDG